MYASTVATVALLATAAVASPVQARDLSRETFGDKCLYLTLKGNGKKGQTALSAVCKDDAGKEFTTTLNLNHCLGTNAGNLIYKDEYVLCDIFNMAARLTASRGNFDQVCSPYLLSQLEDGPPKNVALKTNCLPSLNGVPKYTYVTLDPPSKS